MQRCGALGGQHRIEDLPAAEGCEGVGKDWVQCGDVLGGGGFVRVDLQHVFDTIFVVERCRRIRPEIPDAAEVDRAATDRGIVGDRGFDQT
ncbi:hypothetical protein AZG88_27075 [Rhodococcus sp. LB1]|nr:hypothetical protein AZG88_27075 [Rhodococcus sp. LB1]